MKLAILAVLLCVGCGDDMHTNTVDGGIDATDAPPPGTPDYFGEPCAMPSSLGSVSLCREDLPYPHAYCTPEATCRPFCGSVSVSGGGTRTCKDVGGVETYAFPTSGARVCYCTPP